MNHEIIKCHHTLIQILNGLLECGFTIEAVVEPSRDMIEKYHFEEELKHPMMLLVKVRK